MVGASSSSGNTSTSTNSGHTFGQDLAQQSPTGTVASVIAPAASLSSQVQNALQPSGSSSTVDADAVIEQMVKGMTMRTVAQGTSEIRLQLQPENLGQVTMRLSVTGNQVNATVVAQSADVRSALVANHQELARSLNEAGLTLSGFSVDVSGGDAGQDQSKDRTAGFGRRYVVHELSGNTTAETTEAPSLGPSLLGGSNLELFNSLA
jgi:flagellar hook-length control protein FliK